MLLQNIDIKMDEEEKTPKKNSTIFLIDDYLLLIN